MKSAVKSTMRQVTPLQAEWTEPAVVGRAAAEGGMEGGAAEAAGAAKAASGAAADRAEIVLTPSCRACIDSLLTRDWRERKSATEALHHPWLARGPGACQAERAMEERQETMVGGAAPCHLAGHEPPGASDTAADGQLEFAVDWAAVSFEDAVPSEGADAK